jgi:hypothetical protein
MDGDPPEPGGAAPDAQQPSTSAQPAALREDQVQSAVAFLSHPKASRAGSTAASPAGGPRR